eukprot:CAMPEP_0202892794 /NCGR_PEP_ID=MMETSP1392-20130828/2489_1 /ASSEMBLY_ACC=CAM_ASM_000868 /TAXON_ID=225041 /ORGANISM="Chlamydomonas chlamydogama, Strain SAG 11-48b" /LENGTH=133 /DNA_ID=CAMNT_0049576883 /DNA_START=254 /DNA_END=651 /DNA_ORIENTATION=+
MGKGRQHKRARKTPHNANTPGIALLELPLEVQVLVAGRIDDVEDSRTLFRSCKAAAALASQPQLQATWLLRHRPGTALKHACLAGWSEAVRLLVKAGAEDVPDVDGHGRVSLHYAALAGSAATMDVLLNLLPG